MSGRSVMYAKMAGVFVTCCIGGPALMYYVTPAPGELFDRFSPELQKQNLDNRDRRMAEYNTFLQNLKEYSKSDKPIWEAQKEAEAKIRAEKLLMAQNAGLSPEEEAKRKMREEMRAAALGRG